MTDSCGKRSNSARATVSPPIPESNTPSGALFMDRDTHADAAGESADLEIGGEITQVGRDVFPGHERGARQRPPRGRLPPSRKQERPEESAHGPEAAMHGVGREDYASGISSRRILSYKSARRHDCKSDHECD